jgi:regulator of RNase E activity RraB
MLYRRSLEAFAKHGDDLSLARPVTHWLYFAQAADRALAAHELARAGFAIELLSPLEDDAGLQFGLCLERVDRIDQESIDTVVFDILDVVEGYEAEYDGWEAPVETGPGSAGPSDATAEEA